nr:hypothetical protein [Lachnospiraceae bacterium]
MKNYSLSLIILTLFALYGGFQLGLFPSPFAAPVTPAVIAHRGDRVHAPENTLSAFYLALEGESDGIELDVQKTKDQVPVVFHDTTLKRLYADGHRVAEITENEFRKLSNVSHSFESSSGCTLEEALKLCRKYPKARINLDLKASGTEEKVVFLIEKYDLSAQCEVTSKDITVLKKIKKLNPGIKTVLLLSSYYAVSAYKYARILSYIQKEDSSSFDSYVDGISVRSQFATVPLIRTAHSRNQYVYVWTVNSAGETQRMRRLGADGIITDDPSYIAKCIRSDH